MYRGGGERQKKERQKREQGDEKGKSLSSASAFVPPSAIVFVRGIHKSDRQTWINEIKVSIIFDCPREIPLESRSVSKRAIYPLVAWRGFRLFYWHSDSISFLLRGRKLPPSHAFFSYHLARAAPWPASDCRLSRRYWFVAGSSRAESFGPNKQKSSPLASFDSIV